MHIRMHINSWEEVESHRCSHCEGSIDKDGDYHYVGGMPSFLSSLRAKCDGGCSLSIIQLGCIEWATPQLDQTKGIEYIQFDKAVGYIKKCRLFSRWRWEHLELILDGAPNSAFRSNTGSLATSKQIKKWFDTCIKQHDACNSVDPRSSNHAVPIRYLDIENDPILLTESAKSIEYACLSHCWGSGDHIFKTQRSNILEHKSKGIFVERLPKTFQDAIQICHNMDVKYLWIDSLCIVQDDDDDWNVQASRMANVYEGALFTIAASKAHDSSQGCFAQMQRRYFFDTIPGISGVKIRFLLPQVLDLDGITTYRQPRSANHPLYKRGWCLQEQLLSCRILHFGAEEVIWQCMSSMARESDPIFRKKHTSSLSLAPLSHGETSNKVDSLYWHRIVKEYSRRSLTFHKDKLPAISAIARKLQQRHPNCRYVAGLWQETLLEDLLWRTDDTFSQRYTSDDSKVPSWSWASVSGKVGFIAPPLSIIAEIINTTFITEGDEMTGRIKEANILLKAPLLNFRELRTQTDQPLRSGYFSLDDPAVLLETSRSFCRRINSWTISWDHLPILSRNSLEDDISKDLWVMVIGLEEFLTDFEVVCLIVKKNHDINTYSRVGLVKLESGIEPKGSMSESMKRMEMSEVILI